MVFPILLYLVTMAGPDTLSWVKRSNTTSSSSSYWAKVAVGKAPATPPLKEKPTKAQPVWPAALISNKSVALRPSKRIQALPLKQVIAHITIIGVMGARGIRTLPSGQIKVVFIDPAVASAAKASPAWIRALDLEVSLYERLFSLRVQGLSREEARLFEGAEAALEAQNGVKVYKLSLIHI